MIASVMITMSWYDFWGYCWRRSFRMTHIVLCFSINIARVIFECRLIFKSIIMQKSIKYGKITKINTFDTVVKIISMKLNIYMNSILASHYSSWKVLSNLLIELNIYPLVPTLWPKYQNSFYFANCFI